jgi:gluconate 2-dehydrogenase alpha chain
MTEVRRNLGPLVASTAIEDFSGELVLDYDQSVLWGSTRSLAAISNPFETCTLTNAPRGGERFPDWMRDNCTGIRAMSLVRKLKSSHPDNAHAETVC